MKLGLDSYSTRNSGLDPVGVLEYAAGLGLEGVLFELSPFRSFRDDALAAARRAAEDRGLYAHLGMGSIFHWHPMATQGRQLLADAGYDTNVSDAQIVIHHLDVARKLGSPILRCVAGNLFTRDEGHDMTALADRAVAILREACHAAEAMGLKIAMENHADFTVRELASILARVGSPAFGFTVDCANLAFDLDDPLRLAGIMAPYALTTHFKNYRVIRTPSGLALENCWLGDGDIDVAAIARLLRRHDPRAGKGDRSNLCEAPFGPFRQIGPVPFSGPTEINLNIEIHSQFAPFKLSILEDGFFGRHPAPPGDGLAWYLKKAWDKPIVAIEPPNLPDGPESWKLEREHVECSVRWAREQVTG